MIMAGSVDWSIVVVNDVVSLVSILPFVLSTYC